jgi:SP family facilitated glucose transporter-like MFS transporter 8
VPQVIAGCVAQSIVIQAGVSMAFSAVLLPQLMENDIFLTTTTDQLTWIASLVTIGTLLGSLITGPLMDKFGRKTICQVSCVPLIVAWILVWLAQNVETLYAGRLLAGFGGGLSTVALVYVSEVSNPKIRPMLLCLNSVFVSTGILLTCVLAQWFTWREMSVWFGTLAFLSCVAIWLLPESPTWLVSFKRKKRETVMAAVKWLNRNPQRCQEELGKVMEAAQHQTQNPGHSFGGLRFYSNLIMVPSILKPLTILFFIFLFQQLSGGYVVIFYAIQVFQITGGNFEKDFDEYDTLVIMGLIRFVMSIIAALASRRFGRRILSILSGLGMCITTLIIAIYCLIEPVEFTGGFINLQNSTDTVTSTESTHWTCVVCILLYVCFSSLGVLVIPWTLIGELLPITIRGIGSGIMVAVAYILMFGVVKSFPFALSVIGTEGIFFFFSFMSLTGVVFVYKFLPETLGKTLQEIENDFK